MKSKLGKVLGGSVMLASAMAFSPASADELEKVVFGTNWYAQAEHGGFYQALATGLYKEHGLDVEIKMGGPQVNGTQLLVTGRYDLLMGYPIGNINAVEKGLPVMTVAASMQGDPQSLVAHPHVESIEQIKEEGLPIYLATHAHSTFWPWLKAEYGFEDDVVHAYTFSVAPFLTDENIVQQGYLSSEPFAIQKGGIEPNVFLLSDHGYPPYATTIETTTDMIEERPDVVKRFVKASMEGWQSYLENPEPGNQMIMQENPEMTPEQIAYGIKKIKEYELVTGGDAGTQGIGVMTEERWTKIGDFMVGAGLASEDLDLSKVFTLEFLPEEPVLP